MFMIMSCYCISMVSFNCVSLVLFMIISISGRPSPFSTSTLVSVKSIKRIIVYYVSNQSALMHSTVPVSRFMAVAPTLAFG